MHCSLARLRSLPTGLPPLPSPASMQCTAHPVSSGCQRCNSGGRCVACRAGHVLVEGACRKCGGGAWCKECGPDLACQACAPGYGFNSEGICQKVSLPAAGCSALAGDLDILAEVATRHLLRSPAPSAHHPTSPIRCRSAPSPTAAPAPPTTRSARPASPRAPGAGTLTHRGAASRWATGAPALPCGACCGNSTCVGRVAAHSNCCRLAALQAPEACMAASPSGACLRCERGFGKSNGGRSCQRCLDPTCLSCPDSPGVCTECFTGKYVDPSTKRCADCGPGCASCRDARTCTKCFFLSLVVGSCRRCDDPRCADCTGNTEVCRECKRPAAYEPHPTTGRCVRKEPAAGGRWGRQQS